MMTSLTKHELVDKLATKNGLTLQVAKEAVQFILDETQKALIEGRKVEFRDFGVFKPARRAERKGRNPANIAAGPFIIPARNVVKFKVGAKLDSALNEGKGSVAPAAQH